MPDRLAAPLVLRIAGVADFVLACVCIATPLVRSALGQAATTGFAAVLLIGSGVMFFMAKRMDREGAVALTSTGGAPLR